MNKCEYISQVSIISKNMLVAGLTKILTNMVYNNPVAPDKLNCTALKTIISLIGSETQ